MDIHGCGRLPGLGLALLVISLLGRAAQAETLTLAQALALAYETNPRLEAQRAALRATDEDVAQALSGWRPTVSVNASYGYTKDDTSPPDFPVVAPNGHPRDAGVTLTQPVINGITIPQTRAAKAGVEAGRTQLSSVEQTTLLAAAGAYINVLDDGAELDFKRQNVALLTDQMHMTEERVAIRDVARSDLDLVLARLNSARADAVSTEAKLATSRATFLRTVGRVAEKLEASPLLPAVPESEAQALTKALATNPDLLTAKNLVSQADAAVSVAHGALVPSLSLQLQYKNSVDELATGVRDSGLSVIAQLHMPLYQSGTEYAEISRTNELLSKARFSATDVEHQVRENLESTWQTHVSTRTAINLDKAQVDAATSAFQGIYEGLKVGERTTFDVLSAEQDLATAQEALVEAKRQYALSTFQLLATTGGFTAKALGLAVTFYDPKAHYDRAAGNWFATGATTGK